MTTPAVRPLLLGWVGYICLWLVLLTSLWRSSELKALCDFYLPYSWLL